MPFMLKIQWDIRAGSEADFRANQEALCKVMLEHPGVICYHADYPSQRVSQWTEIYANDEAFAAHLGQALVRDEGHDVWSLAQAPVLRGMTLEAGLAPDFQLPDRQGKAVRLSDFRGKKVLLLTWASW